MAPKFLEEGLSASEKISARCGYGSEKARLPPMLKVKPSNHHYKDADDPPEPRYRHHSHLFSRIARYILLALFLGLILQFWNVHFPELRILNFARKPDLLSKTGKPNVELSTSTVSQPASPCRSLIYVPC